MKAFLSLVTVSSSKSTGTTREKRQSPTENPSPLFTENIDLFLDTTTQSWFDILNIESTPSAGDFEFFQGLFPETTESFDSFLIPTTVPSFIIPSTTENTLDFVDFTTDISTAILGKNTPWPEVPATTVSSSIDELLAELSTDSPFDILGPTELPADLLDLLFQTTESSIIDLFTVPEDIELPAATTADTLIEVESTVPVTASTSVSPSGVTENDTVPSTTAKSTTTTQSGLPTAEGTAASVETSASTTASTESSSTSAETEAESPATEKPVASTEEASVTEAPAENNSTIQSNTSKSTETKTDEIPATESTNTTAPSQDTTSSAASTESTPASNTTSATTPRPDTTTPVESATTPADSSASQVMLSALVVFILALFQ